MISFSTHVSNGKTNHCNPKRHEYVTNHTEAFEFHLLTFVLLCLKYLELACSPKTGSYGMRVLTALWGEETFYAEDET
jgi:hypothetical protein